jgi:hypothetical protein
MWQASFPRTVPKIDAPMPPRSGLVGWWLNLTAPPRPAGILVLAERERIRKAELTSYGILAVFAFLLIVVSYTLTQPSVRIAVIAMAIGLCVAALLNRSGWTRTAAYLVPLLLMAMMMLAVVAAPGGLSYPWLFAYDLLAIPILLAAITLDKRAPWVLAFLAVVFILLDFFLQPHNIINAQGVSNFDHIAYTERTVGWWGMVNRPLALVGFAAFLSWLGARSVEQAIARADHAEEILRLQQSFAETEAKRTEQVNAFIQQLVEAFVAQASGTERYLEVPDDHPLAATAQFLNQRLERLRGGSRDEGWRARQIASAVKLLEEQLMAVATGAAPLGYLQPPYFHTQVQQVDRLAALIYTLAEQARPGHRPSGPAGPHRPGM